MDLVLTSADQAQLSAAMNAIASPLNCQSSSEWAISLLGTLRPLFGADTGAFVFGDNQRSAVGTLGLPSSYVEEYITCQEYDQATVGLANKELVAVSTRMVGDGKRLSICDAEMYSMFWRRFNIEDGVFTVMGAAENGPLLSSGRLFGPAEQPIHGILALYGDRCRFSEREEALMRMLAPSIRAAIQVWGDLADCHRSLHKAIDAAREALVIADGSGTIIHCNPVAARLLQSLGTAIDATALIRRIAALQVTVQDAVIGDTRIVFRALRADSIFGVAGTVLIQMARYRRRKTQRTLLEEQYRLTSRESEIALLIALGLSNKALSKSLNISIHTARRHVERILQKLGVNSRNQVGALLRS